MDVVLDQVQDVTGREIHRLTSLYTPPDFVKSASHDSICGNAQSLPNNVYADPRYRRYPCHTAAATWMSAAFFAEKQGSYNKNDVQMISERIHNLADQHGIRDQIDAVMTKIAADAADSSAGLSDKDFAWVWEDENGTKDRRLPLRNAHEVKAAADYLTQYRDEFIFTDRQQMATRILEKAAEYKVTVDGCVEKQAGHGFCAAKTAARFLRERARVINNKEIAGQLRKTAATVEQNSATSRKGLMKLAEVVDNIDRAFGINRQYGPAIPRPEEVFFGVTEQVVKAAQVDHVPMTSGAIYKLADLAQVKLQDVRDWMGNDLANEVSTGGVLVDREKLAEILPTLPRGDAELFERMLDKSGITPFAKEAAATKQGLRKQDLFELAANYVEN